MASGTLTEEQYASRVDRIYDRVLKDRIVACLERVGGAFSDAGYSVDGPFDLSDDEYRWYIAVDGNGLTEAVDVSIEIAESLAYDGETDGLNLRLSIVAYGGRVLGGLTPYNYTSEVWASLQDLHEIDRRMRILEEADASSAVRLVDEFAAESA